MAVDKWEARNASEQVRVMSETALRIGMGEARYDTSTMIVQHEISVVGGLAGVVGENGSGKSTFLKSISGHVGFSGDILLNGRRLPFRRPWSRRDFDIAYLPQEGGAFGELSILENVRLAALQSHRLNRDPIAELAVWLPNLGRRLHQPAKMLSGGEYQRLALCMSLNRGCGILLLDEPSVNLDERGITLLLETLDALLHQGTMILMAEQNLDLINALASHTSLMIGVSQRRTCHVRAAGPWERARACAEGRCTAFSP